MKNIFGYTCFVMITASLYFIFLSCNNNTGSKNNEKDTVNSLSTNRTIIKKPGSTYNDTLRINFPAAVFYHPDSVQLSGIKAITDSMVFDGSMHEYFYQMRNSRMVIKKTWPSLKIIESEKYRYLMFIKKDGTRDYIDLNTKNDAHGLFVFDGIKSPVLVDMTNIESIVGFYLSKK